MQSCDRAIKFLRELGREDLAELLLFSTYRYVQSTHFKSFPSLEVTSPKIYTEALSGLPEWERKRITESIVHTNPVDLPGTIPPTDLMLKSNSVQIENALYPEIIIHKNQLIDVSTGGSRIQDCDDYYKARHRRIIQGLDSRGIENPNSFESLWDWFNTWKSTLHTYAERRRFVNDMYAPVLSKVLHADEPVVPLREPTGWERVDRGTEKARARFESAHDEEDYQTVGLLCREILISLGQAVYDPELHVTLDGATASTTDAGRMIEAFLAQAAAGRSFESVRRHARAALQLTVELQHKRTADFRAAALCLEATSSLTNILAILCGRRDPQED